MRDLKNLGSSLRNNRLTLLLAEGDVKWCRRGGGSSRWRGREVEKKTREGKLNDAKFPLNDRGVPRK